MDAGMTNGRMMCGAGVVDHSLGSGSSLGSGGFVPPGMISVNKKQIDMDWSDEEQAVLEHCLAKYAAYNTTNIGLYARISLQLNNKTVRDVAMRCRWMSQREKAKKKKEDKKERSIDNAAPAPNSNIVSKAGFSPYASQRTATNNNNGSSVFFNATVQLLHHNSRVFDQISANLTSNQIQDNIVLLRYARNNLFNILSELNEQQSFISRMPPLPVELNDELANSILAPASTCPPWK
ncbi:unnamed protein product [Cuscuta campestris]|uniref:Myb-like domain-containing protein n=2 Tax=Cuscuta sect. Cleistogrammica TaxID=1824901 RepID=A0A484L809_9ASTE|nr:hypothetical protein DM860_005715 [Cuscuta australis]VFQ72487.1 unnamed protein product [Cuscuta campestris]